MAASLSDSSILGTNVKFMARVQAALVAACGAIATESTATASHPYRLQLVHAVLARPTAMQDYATLFAWMVSTDALVLADATQAGTVVLSSGNADAQQALVTDAHIQTAVSGFFNAFCQGIPA